MRGAGTHDKSSDNGADRNTEIENRHNNTARGRAKSRRREPQNPGLHRSRKQTDRCSPHHNSDHEHSRLRGASVRAANAESTTTAEAGRVALGQRSDSRPDAATPAAPHAPKTANSTATELDSNSATSVINIAT